MWQRAPIVLPCLFALSCGGPSERGATPPASEGVESFVASLRSDDPAAAYALLSDELKARVSFDEFAAQWRAAGRERAAQATALEEGLEGDPNLGERAKIVYPDGKSVYVRREGGSWQLESAVVSQVHAGRPHDAVRIFADALAKRDYAATLRILTKRRRDGMADQVESFVSSLLEHLASDEDAVELIGEDRAELRWDDAGRRYRIVLRREGDEWRVDDIHLRPVPARPDE